MPALYIFHGGKEQLVLRVDDNREVSINYPPIFGSAFITLDDVAKKADDSVKAEIAQYNTMKGKMSDKEFDGYLIREFTKGQWAGFRFVRKVNIKR